MNKRLLYCLLLTIFLSYPITICNADIIKEKCNIYDLDIKKGDMDYCNFVIDGYKYILQSQENRYSDENSIDGKTLEYITNVNEKITYYEKKCGIYTDTKDVLNILITKK